MFSLPADGGRVFSEGQMKAKRSVAALSVTGIVVVSVVAGIDLFSSPGSISASEQVSGRADSSRARAVSVVTAV